MRWPLKDRRGRAAVRRKKLRIRRSELAAYLIRKLVPALLQPELSSLLADLEDLEYRLVNDELQRYRYDGKLTIEEERLKLLIYAEDYELALGQRRKTDGD